MDFIYPANFDQDNDGGYVVTFPDIPEAITQGDNLGEALINAADALDEAVCAYIDAGIALPTAGWKKSEQRQIATPVQTVLKYYLRNAMKDQGTSNVQLAALLEVNEKVVRRMTDLNHNTKLDSLQAGLLVLGTQPVVTMVPA
jgi:antitoxin HicB